VPLPLPLRAIAPLNRWFCSEEDHVRESAGQDNGWEVAKKAREIEPSFALKNWANRIRRDLPSGCPEAAWNSKLRHYQIADRSLVRVTNPNLPHARAARPRSLGFRFQPDLRWPATIRRVDPLRDDAFEAQPGGAREHGRAIVRQMFIELGH
jgi:hypothetical protein